MSRSGRLVRRTVVNRLRKKGKQMRYMSVVKMAATVGAPPPELVEAMGEAMGAAFADGSVVDAGGLWPERTEFRLQGGTVTTVDGPYAETKEIVGGYAILEARSHEEAVEGARRMIEMHQKLWPGWEGSVEVRRISEPEEGPPPA
jgi:hypothetical protein